MLFRSASQKFEPADVSGGGGGGESAPSIPIPSPPAIDTQKNNTNQDTKFDDNGKKISSTNGQPVITVKAQVVETEMTDKQMQVKQIEAKNKF